MLGLEVGADDYIVKPFEGRELVARVRSAIRRLEKGRAGTNSAEIARFRGWAFNPNGLLIPRLSA